MSQPADYAEYVQGADAGDLLFRWRDTDGKVIPFAAGWTFELRVGKVGAPAQFAKTDGITGADELPNVTVEWATSGELNTLGLGLWDVQIIATRTADGAQRILNRRGSLLITRPITAPA